MVFSLEFGDDFLAVLKEVSALLLSYCSEINVPAGLCLGFVTLALVVLCSRSSSVVFHLSEGLKNSKFWTKQQ